MRSLFHGTTRSRAESIRDEGWTIRPLAEEVDAVATTHQVSTDAIWADLRARRRFVDGATRGQVASFATSLEQGDSWAQRAPEIRSEALHAAWRILHPDLAEDPDAQIDGEIWALRQCLEDPPAIVRAELTDDELVRECSYGGLTRGSLDRDHLELLWDGLPEIEVPLPVTPDRVREVMVLPRRIRGAVAVHLLALTPDDWIQRAKAGEFGVPHRDRYGQLTWAWDDLAEHVVAEQWERRVPLG